MNTQKPPVVIIYVGPSGLGKSGITELLERESGYTSQKSLIEFTPLKIRYNEDKKLYELANRLPRKNGDDSIWNGVDDPESFDLQDDEQREKLQSQIDEGIHTFDKINWENVLKSDLKLYEWLEFEDYWKRLNDSTCHTNAEILNQNRAYVFQKDKGNSIVEVTPSTLELNYDTLINAGFDVYTVICTAPLSMMAGHINWRGDIEAEKRNRYDYNIKFLNDLNDPQTDFYKVTKKIDKDGRLLRQITTENIFQVSGEHRFNGETYRFQETGDELKPELKIKKLEGRGPVDINQAHVNYILNFIKANQEKCLIPEGKFDEPSAEVYETELQNFIVLGMIEQILRVSNSELKFVEGYHYVGTHSLNAAITALNGQINDLMSKAKKELGEFKIN